MSNESPTVPTFKDYKQIKGKKSAFDMVHVKSVSCMALVYDGEIAGKIVANWSDNPNGSTCTATVSIWSGPFKNCPRVTGQASGYGYDKFSAAVWFAMAKAAVTESELGKPFDGCGSSMVIEFFERFGYKASVLLSCGG